MEVGEERSHGVAGPFGVSGTLFLRRMGEALLAADMSRDVGIHPRPLELERCDIAREASDIETHLPA